MIWTRLTLQQYCEADKVLNGHESEDDDDGDDEHTDSIWTNLWFTFVWFTGWVKFKEY